MYLKLRVEPGARRPHVEQISTDTFKVRVTEKAERNQATKAALASLATFLNLPAATLKLVKGGHSPSKTVEISDSLWKKIS